MNAIEGRTCDVGEVLIGADADVGAPLSAAARRAGATCSTIPRNEIIGISPTSSDSCAMRDEKLPGV